MAYDHDKTKNKFSDWVKEIIQMERDGDSSMQSVYIDMVVTEYVKQHLKEIKSFLDYIIQNQKEKDKSYGDFDASFTKEVRITKIKGSYPNSYDYIFQGYVLRDSYSGVTYFILKETAISKYANLAKYPEITYHVRQVVKDVKPKSIPATKYFNYGDERDEGYVLSFSYNNLGEIFKTNYIGMIYKFQKFKEFFRTLKFVNQELSQRIG